MEIIHNYRFFPFGGDIECYYGRRRRRAQQDGEFPASRASVKWGIDFAGQVAAKTEHLDSVDVVADMQREARQDRAVGTVLAELAISPLQFGQAREPE